MSSNYWPAFNNEFFAKHQRKLLWLLNTPVIGWWFRRVMRIDCKVKIFEFQPNNYKTYLPDGQIQADLRTHWKYAKRLYFAFKPMWWVLHAWDTVFADRLVPTLSFGLLTLTQYPDTGNPGATTIDAAVRNTGAVFATVHDAADGNALERADTGNQMGIFYGVDAGTYYIDRGFCNFDTSSLTSSSVISAAVLSLFGNGAAENGDTTSLSVVTHTAGTNSISTADYDLLGTTKWATDFALSGWNGAAYNDISLNATGLAGISKTGVTKIGLRILLDINNSAPAARNNATAKDADTAGTTNDPKLVVTYTIAAATAGAFIMAGALH